MASYALLDEAEEGEIIPMGETCLILTNQKAALHKSRLLNVEEKPFKRISKRLLEPGKSIISTLRALPPTPPPDASAADEEAASLEKDKQHELEKQRQWVEEARLDFAAFESSIIRIQLLLISNEKERERYAAEKLNIQANAQAVRDNTADLRIQLEEAQRTLELRKEYDVLAEKITSNRNLKPREEQHMNLEKLNAEIADLEQESQEYAMIWNRRREQFDKIIDQTTEMQRQIKDEKEEVERREGMEEDDEEQRGGTSGNATPRPSEAGGATPMYGIDKEVEVGIPGGLSVAGHHAARGRSPLRESQTVIQEEDKKLSDLEEQDAEMAEDGEVSTEADGMKADAPEGLVAEDKEEGEEEEHQHGDRMDVT